MARPSDIRQLPLPSAPEAEAALIGCLLMGGVATYDELIALGIGVDAFLNADCRRAWEVAGALAATGMAVDAVTLKDKLGGKPADADLCVAWMNAATSATNAPSYARITLEKAAQRQRIVEAARIVDTYGDGIVEGEDDESTTDVGLARRIARSFQGKLLWVPAWGHWLVYESGVWAKDDLLRADRAVESTLETEAERLRTLAAEAREAAGDDPSPTVKQRINGLQRTACSLESDRKIAAVTKRLRHRVATTPTEMDKNDWLLNLENGTLDLKTGTLHPHNPADRLMAQAPVEFAPDAECPLWDKFIAETFSGNADTIAYIYRVLGMGLCGDAREPYLFVFYGTGGNGKNVLLDTVCGLMGPYAAQAAPNLIVLKGHGDDHPTNIADLFGKRLVVSSEIKEGARLDVDSVKRLTGDRYLKGRLMRQDFFEFVRKFKLVLRVDTLPSVTDMGPALWRRVRVVPFLNVVPEDRQNKMLTTELIAERPGILNRLVAGCLDWQRQGLMAPSIVTSATGDYQENQDPLLEFIEACLVVEPEAFLVRQEAFKVYVRFQMEAHEHHFGKNLFYQKLQTALGPRHPLDKSRKANFARGFRNIRFSERGSFWANEMPRPNPWYDKEL